MNFLLRHIEYILGSYDASVPLAVYLKNYFRSSPKLGSRDRKAISHGVYLFYRYARRLDKTHSPFDVIFAGIRLSGSENSFLETVLLRNNRELPSQIAPIIPPDDTNRPVLSAGITTEEWEDHFLTQPDIFIRVRNNNVCNLLEKAGIPFSAVDAPADCIRLSNRTDLDQILPPDSYVVQDWASQQSIQILLDHIGNRRIDSAWDCCAGAGGKSLMLKDELPELDILATDIRGSILHNLTQRFAQYGLTAPDTQILNLSDKLSVSQNIGTKKFDLILCDAPCSGSGTWARTPEQYYFFKKDTLKSMRKRQFSIASNTLPYLNENGLFAYITCSVFREENEAITEKLATQHRLKIVDQQLINGVSRKADSMFIALLEKERPEPKV